MHLKLARTMRGLTQWDLGIKIGRSGTFISLIERGYRMPRPAEELRIAEALDMKPSELEFGRWKDGER